MEPQPRSLKLRTRDADEAQALAGAFLYPQRMDLLDRSTPLDLVMYAGAGVGALEYLREHAADPITTADIAAHCWVSVRTLQEGFQRHVGRPPLAELRRVRLDRARGDLQRGDAYSDSVAAVAHRWGFGHLGRFASAYEAEFGERPSSTLRAGG